MSELVLVTGGSGFIAGHIILQLIDRGYAVRATLRSLSKETDVRAVLKDAGLTDDAALTFVEADLLADDGWTAAVAGVDHVMHVASPVMPGRVDNEDDVIVPAREGTLRVLRAAAAAGVRRVVLTSAFHAVSWGHPHSDHVFTEADWTVLDGPGVDAYGKAKTLAEHAAWEVEGIELVTMLPVAVMGPVMGKDVSGANHIVQSMLSGAMPGAPDLYIPIVDVRDVAAAHVLALETPAAAGQRFLLSNGATLSMAQIAVAAGVSLRSTPSFVVRLAALFRPEFRATVPDLGYRKQTSNAKARDLLGWSPRPAEQAIGAAAESMVAKGLVGN